MAPEELELERLVSMPLSAILFVTDFDGTLAPIVREPSAAAALPESIAAMAGLAAGGLTVAVLSGRPASFLESHVAIPAVRLLGDNGLERPSLEEEMTLQRFNVAVAATVRAFPGVRLDSTSASSSVHFRAAPEVGGILFEEVSRVASELGLVASPGRMVVEVHPHRGTKTRALDTMIRSARPRLVVYAGDDEGDRAAFTLLSVLECMHLAIGIRSEETDPEVFAECNLTFDSPAGFAAFLTEWVKRIAVPAIPTVED